MAASHLAQCGIPTSHLRQVDVGETFAITALLLHDDQALM
jgi:hypothetical protein